MVEELDELRVGDLQGALMAREPALVVPAGGFGKGHHVLLCWFINA
jgi:hypothetical protein